MSSSYPSSIRTFQQKVDQVDIVEANDYNELAAEISALERTLGVNVASAGTRSPTATDLVQRLANLDAALRAVELRFDGSGLIPQSGVAGLVVALNDITTALASLVGSSAFSSLSTSISTLARSSDLDAERAARVAGDTALTGSVTAETAARQAADAALSALISSNTARVVPSSGWVNITPNSNNSIVPFTQPMQVMVRNGVCYLRGSGKYASFGTFAPYEVSIGALPSFACPSQDKVFPISTYGFNDDNSGAGRLTIRVSGAISVFLTSRAVFNSYTQNYSESFARAFIIDGVSFADVISTSPYAL